MKFLIKSDSNEKADELITYSQLCEFLEDQIAREEKQQDHFQFNRIIGHSGPLKPTDHGYKGSSYNVMLEWCTGEITSEPLDLVGNDDPVTCAIYAKDHGLLDTPGWKRYRNLVKNDKKLARAINQTKLCQARRMPKYKFGVEVPHDYKDAMRLDEQNGNHRWQESVDIEMGQIHEYKTFIDKGKVRYSKEGRVLGVGNEYKRVRVHLVFDVKHCGKYKARLVADGSRIQAPAEGVYSGVVSLKSLRLVMFIAELNQLELWGADVGNAYLESYTKEKLFVIAGPEFGELEGHLLIMSKALYGTKTAGQCWHHKLEDTLRDLGFQPCLADGDVWLKRNGDTYDYIAVYVDDLCLAMKDPKAFVEKITGPKYNFKLKGVGPLSYHLGASYKRDPDGTLTQGVMILWLQVVV